MTDNIVKNRTREMFDMSGTNGTIKPNGNRFAIYRYIQKHPGAYYSEIMKELNLPAGVMTYHLQKLVKEKLIISHHDGYFTRFYPYEVESYPHHFSPKQKEILDIVYKNEIIPTCEIASILRKTYTTVIYHANNLKNKGVLSSKKVNGKSQWFLTDREQY